MTATIGAAVTSMGQPVNAGTYYHLPDTTSGALVKTGGGVLYSVILSGPVATGVVTLYDGLSTSGKVMAIITVPASPQPVTLRYDLEFATGLYVVVATAAQDLTISFR